MTSLDHISLSTADYDKSLAFYLAALAPLGITSLMSFGDVGRRTAGLGVEFPYLWIAEGGALTGGRLHLAFRADSRALVDAFHAAAMAAGGTNNGAPGPRAQYHPTYYGAFVLDPDGHNIEAVCHAPE